MIALGLLAACTPAAEPEPEPTKTALFASDEEAFAAAEETYRAYTDASNAAERGETEADPQDYLIGSALEGAIDAHRALEEAGLRLDGDVSLSKFLPLKESIRPGREQLSAIVCLDLTAARTVNSQGEDVTPADRPDVIAASVTMLWVDGSYYVSEEFDEDNSKCDG